MSACPGSGAISTSSVGCTASRGRVSVEVSPKFPGSRVSLVQKAGLPVWLLVGVGPGDMLGWG
ncbi:hypothetical protein G7085_03620 [Tessaracoccus sp. HDW20]|uniref:hypothetical protein n=1 Tax=Tessaracoccus coleopterorum TaxID=2714950 RepID=UPI0018D2BE80|nr:hypothetical protein [Tessaracoccus coleopterorum]NHB84048.1 hypothetical protein [Tessaracoccus coleopterorum]